MAKADGTLAREMAQMGGTLFLLYYNNNGTEDVLKESNMAK